MIYLKILFSFLIIFSLFSCKEDEIVNPELGNDVLTIDTLIVQAIYDNPPDAKSPKMKYKIYIVSKLKKEGVVDAYKFNCNDVEYATQFCFTSPRPLGDKFRFEETILGDEISNVGEKIPFDLSIGYDIEGEGVTQFYNYTGTLTVINSSE